MAGAVAGDLPPGATRVGVDGCPAGWVAVAEVDDGWHFDVFERFEDLWTHLDGDSRERVLVDVPIGLREESVRTCDERARELLGSRWNSVFRTPVEAAIERKREEDPDEDLRPEASDANEARTGYGISVQAWNIADKVAELDDFFAAHDPGLDGPVREAHPELAFMAFNGQPVAYSKTDQRGRALRESVLADEGVAVDADLVTAVLDTDVSVDDVLDALVLGRAAREDLATVPQAPDEEQPRIYFPDRSPAWGGQSYFPG